MLATGIVLLITGLALGFGSNIVSFFISSTYVRSNPEKTVIMLMIIGIIAVIIVGKKKKELLPIVWVLLTIWGILTVLALFGKPVSTDIVSWSNTPQYQHLQRIADMMTGSGITLLITRKAMN